MTDDLPPATPAQLEATESVVVDWLKRQLADNPAVAAVEPDAETPRLWAMRVEGDEKKAFTVWFHLRQRSLTAESHFMPAPLEHHAAVWEYLLRRNHRLRGVGFSIGGEDAVYLLGRLPVAWVDEAHLDQLLGGVYEATEACFRTAMRLGFGDRFRG